MKRIAILLSAIIAFFSCTDFNEEEIPVKFGVSADELAFSAGSSTQSVTVSSARKWDVTSMPSWVSLKSISHSSISPYEWTATFSASPNKDYDRESSIIIKTNAEIANVRVAQSGEKGRFVAVESVSLSQTELTLTEGENASLTVEIKPYNASIQDVTWKSGNTSIATVSSNGRVDAVAPGSVLITVTTEDGQKTATCSVTVKAKVVPVTGISLNKTSLTLTEGDVQELIATVTPSNATDKSVTWSSSNTSVATVSSAGVVTAKAAGSATITAKTTDGGKTATCAVTVKAKTIAVTGVSLNKTSMSLLIGGTERLTATVSPTNATNKNVTWSSSNTGVATVDSNGNVSAIKVGTAVITVKTEDGGKTATCAVTVNPISVTGVSLNHTSLTMTVGDTQTLTATVTPSNATDKSVAWSSSNTSVATVSSSGLVSAKSSGTATITVTTNDGGKKATCSVTVISTSGTAQGHEWIDLGLSVKWSPYNYGASSATDNGGYYFWGDPTGTASVNYYSAPLTYHISGTSYDIARQKWGGSWRLPTFSEVKELYTKCSWSWTTLNGKTVLKATGPNGNSIYFVPTGLMYNESYQSSDCVIVLSGDSFNGTSFASYVTIYPYFYKLSPDGNGTEAGHSGDNCRFPIRPVL